MIKFDYLCVKKAYIQCLTHKKQVISNRELLLPVCLGNKFYEKKVAQTLQSVCLFCFLIRGSGVRGEIILLDIKVCYPSIAVRTVWHRLHNEKLNGAEDKNRRQ